MKKRHKIRNVLVVYKKSIFEVYFVKRLQWTLRQKKNLGQRMLRQFERSHEKHYLTLKAVQDTLNQYKVNYCTADRKRQVNYGLYDLVISVGGDGTLLSAASRCKKQLVLGVNSHPEVSVGRFCSANRKNFSNVLKKVVAGKAQVRSLTRLAITLNKKDTGLLALNDVLVCHRNPAAMSHYAINIRKTIENHRTSGIWISTAAGSTGAIQSAGGRPMPLESQRVQYMPRELYFRKDVHYRLRGGILGDKERIRIDSRMEDGMVYVDGSRISFPFVYGDLLEVRSSKSTVSIIDHESRLSALHFNGSATRQRK